jgi:single-strand DNA-binding protein
MYNLTINRVLLVGHLTKDPELRPLHSGSNVCGIRVACSSGYRDAEGDLQAKSNYFDVDVFNAAAENVNRYTHKGSHVVVDGRLQWREWETPGGEKREAVSISASTVVFLDSPEDEIDEALARELVGAGAGGEGDGFVY